METSRPKVQIESLFFLLATLILIFLLKPLLVDGTHIYPHDGAYYHFPTFHFYAENLIQGYYPLWNPFSNGGQPFYPQTFILRMIDLVFVGLIYFYSLFTKNLVLLFNWVYFTLSLIALLGIYLFIRTYTSVLWIRLSLIAILTLSSPFISSLRQYAFQNQIMWVPWFAFFLKKALTSKASPYTYWILIGLFIGWSLQGYYFGGISLFLILGLAGWALWRRSDLKALLKKLEIKRVALMATLVFILSLPSFAVLLNSKEWTFTLRLLPKNFQAVGAQKGAFLTEGGETNYVNPGFFNYEAVKFASSSLNLWDFAQWAYPTGNKNYHGSIGVWGNPSEAYLYLGILPFFIGCLGIFKAKNIHRKFWLWMLIAYGLIGLGPENPLYPALFYSVPVLWVVRHTNQFLMFFTFVFLIFYVGGANYLDEKLKESKSSLKPLWLVFTLPFLLPGFIWGPQSLPYLLTILLSVLPMLVVSISLPRPFDKRLLFVPLLAIALLVDYSFVWEKINRFVRSNRSPSIHLPINSHVEKPQFFNQRKAAPFHLLINYLERPGDPIPEQAPRYLPLLYRKPYALNTLYQIYDADKLPFERLLNSKRWNELFIPTRYFNFLHSGLDPKLIKQRLGVDTPLIEMDGSYSIDSYDYQSLTLTVESEGGPMLWRDGFDPHWKATLDGTAIEVQPAFGIFKMVQLSKGTHELRFTYSPSNFLWALGLYYLVSVAGLISVGILALRAVIHEERKTLA